MDFPWKELALGISIVVNAVVGGLVAFVAVRNKWFIRTQVVQHEITKDGQTVILEMINRERVQIGERFADLYEERRKRHNDDVRRLEGMIGEKESRIVHLEQKVDELVQRENDCNVKVARLEQILIGKGLAAEIPPDEGDQRQPPGSKEHRPLRD